MKAAHALIPGDMLDVGTDEKGYAIRLRVEVVHYAYKVLPEVGDKNGLMVHVDGLDYPLWMDRNITVTGEF